MVKDWPIKSAAAQADGLGFALHTGLNRSARLATGRSHSHDHLPIPFADAPHRLDIVRHWQRRHRAKECVVTRRRGDQQHARVGVLTIVETVHVPGRDRDDSARRYPLNSLAGLEFERAFEHDKGLVLVQRAMRRSAAARADAHLHYGVRSVGAGGIGVGRARDHTGLHVGEGKRGRWREDGGFHERGKAC